MLTIRPRPPTRYHDVHCDQMVSWRRSCSMSLYRSVATSVGATVSSSPVRKGSSSCNTCGTCDSSEKITDVWPLVVFGPVSNRKYYGSVGEKEKLLSFIPAKRDVPCIMKKFGKPGTVLPRYAIGPPCASLYSFRVLLVPRTFNG